MIKESTIHSFLEMKFRDGFYVKVESKNEGLSAMIFRIHEKKQNSFVMSKIFYRDLDITRLNVEYELLLELKSWFCGSLYELETIVSNWMESKGYLII